MIHHRIDILDSIDYWWSDTDPGQRHDPVLEKIPFLNEAFKKVAKKFPSFRRWPHPLVDVPKQAGPSDCMFFAWKYMEFWDGESLKTEINPVRFFPPSLLLY